MPVDYGEKERQFLDGLGRDTGHSLAEWLTAIESQKLPHRNDIIDWLRQEGFSFSKASWLERVFHNGGRPIYSAPNTGPGTARPVPRRERVARAVFKPAPEAPSPAALPLSLPASLPPSLPANPETRVPSPTVAPAVASGTEIDALLAKAKAYRPLAQLLLREIRSRCPRATAHADGPWVVLADPVPFAAILAAPRDVRLYLSLGAEAADDFVIKASPAGIGRKPPHSHMLVLTDARQLNDRLFALLMKAHGSIL